MPATAYISTHVISEKDGRFLLGRRGNTPYASGYLACPAGHVEPDETPVQGCVREAREEIGVVLNPADLVFKTVVHRLQPSGLCYLDFFFRISKPVLDFTMCEPDKLFDLGYYALDEVAHEVVPYELAALRTSQPHICFFDPPGLVA